jgi:hypothetical protein
MWVQLHENMTSLRSAHTASVPYNPWQITTGVYKGLSTSTITEGALKDLNTAQFFPTPTWGPSISLAMRTYTAVANINELGATFQAIDYVPATHACTGGCGGGIVNSSESVYIYNQGTCASPNNCACVNRNSTSTPAFSGSSCETTVCNPLCVNGNCTFNFTSRETSCQCVHGWSGAACSVPLCDLYGCAGASGACVLPDTCQCTSGFYGADCSNECACGDGGACNDGASGTGDCTCAAGIYGVTCGSTCTCINGACNDGSQGNGQCTSCDSG